MPLKWNSTCSRRNSSARAKYLAKKRERRKSKTPFVLNCLFPRLAHCGHTTCCPLIDQPRFTRYLITKRFGLMSRELVVYSRIKFGANRTSTLYVEPQNFTHHLMINRLSIFYLLITCLYEQRERTARFIFCTQYSVIVAVLGKSAFAFYN